jgi:hypothetical protein
MFTAFQSTKAQAIYIHMFIHIYVTKHNKWYSMSYLARTIRGDIAAAHYSGH